LVEAEASNEGSDDFENRRLRPKKNVGHGWQATVGGDRIDDWYNDDSRSNRSCDVQPGVVPVVTPEEIRYLYYYHMILPVSTISSLGYLSECGFCVNDSEFKQNGSKIFE
jgi:hypothetical protein